MRFQVMVATVNTLRGGRLSGVCQASKRAYETRTERCPTIVLVGLTGRDDGDRPTCRALSTSKDVLAIWSDFSFNNSEKLNTRWRLSTLEAQRQLETTPSDRTLPESP